MMVTIELGYGPNRSTVVTRENMQRTIDAMDRAISRCNLEDSTILTDARSILVALQNQLPERRKRT